MTGLAACKASETLTSNPSRVDSCSAIFELAMSAFSTYSDVSKSPCGTKEDLTLVTRGQAHDNNVFDKMPVVGRIDELDDLVVNDACIRIVDSAMSTNKQLGCLFVVDLSFRLQ